MCRKKLEEKRRPFDPLSIGRSENVQPFIICLWGTRMAWNRIVKIKLSKYKLPR